MKTINIDNFDKYLFDAIESVISSNKQIKIATNNGNVILMSEKEYNSLLETANLKCKSELLSKIKDAERENTSEMARFNPAEEW